MSSSLRSSRGALQRLCFVDATRGMAMALACLSHFGIFYFGNAGAIWANDITARMALPATPSFMLVSGIVLGALIRSRRGRSDELTIKLFDRALFLLIPGHVLIRLSHWTVIGHAPASSHWLFITDVIAVCLFVSAWITPRTTGRDRILLGLALLALSWLVFLGVQPSDSLASFFEIYLFGEPQSALTGVVFPIVPWLAFYLMATVIGERLVVWQETGRNATVRLAALAVPCLALASMSHVFRWHGGSDFLSAGQKYPPSPAYLLMGAGVGLGALALNSWLEQRGLFGRVLAHFALVGRASLAVFVVQYFVYYLVFPGLDLPLSRLWPLYLTASLAFNFAVAWAWDRHQANRWFTVGLLWLSRLDRKLVRPSPAVEQQPRES